MEVLAIIPFILMLLVYLGFIVFFIWVLVSFIKAQKDRNDILKEISSKLERIEIAKKEE